MTQILIAINDLETREILRARLPQSYGVEVIVSNSFVEAKSFLEILPDIDIVLCSDQIGKDLVASKICEFLLLKKEEDPREVKVVVIGKNAPVYPQLTVVGERTLPQKIAAYLGFLLGKEKRNILIEEMAIEKEKAERERIEREKQLQLLKEREERERIEREKAEQAEKREKEEKKKALEERIAKEKVRQEKLEQEKREKEKAEKERIEKERIEKERIDNEKKAASERLEKDKAARIKLEQEKLEKEKAEKELEREKQAREKIERGKERIAQMAREKAALEMKRQIAPKNDDHNHDKDDDDDEGAKTTVFRLPVQQKTKEVATEVASVEYHPISTIYFLGHSDIKLEFCAYSRIKKSEGFEYTKKIEANVNLSAKEIERILIRCGKELYITLDDLSKASAFLNELFLARYKNSNLNLSGRIRLNSDSFEILLQVFKFSTFDKYNIQIIKELVKSIDLSVRAASGVEGVRQVIKNNKLSYGYIHLHLTCLIFLQIIEKFPWSKEQSRNKIIYLSLFHDLTLNSDRLIKIHHQDLKEINNLNEEEKNIINNHADATATILENIIKAPAELIAFVREHHGIKSGKGFAPDSGGTSSPVSLAFMVIEDFVTRYLAWLEKNDRPEDGQLAQVPLVEVFGELKQKYNKPTYAEVLREIQAYFARRIS